MISCSHHPSLAAEHRCRPCAANLCNDCVEGSPLGGAQCKQCRALALPLTGGPSVDGRFVKNLPRVFGYLKEPSVWAVLVAMALLTAIMHTMSSGHFFALTIAGIETSIFFHITVSSANGKKTLEPPDFTDVFETIGWPLVLLVTAFLPLLASFYWALDTLVVDVVGLSFDVSPMAQLAIVASIALVPLTLTIAAMTRSALKVLNPLVWVETLRAFGLNYVFAALTFYLLWGLELVFARDLLVEFYSVLDVPVLGAAVWSLVLYLPCALRYRTLGVLCEPLMGDGYDHVEQPSLPTARVEGGAARATAVASTSMATAAEPKDAAYEDERLGLLEDLRTGRLDDRDILQLARNASSRGDHALVYRAVETMWKTQRTSPSLPPALWLAAQSQEASGEEGAMIKTLELLLQCDGDHPLAEEARRKLDKVRPA